MRLAAYNSTYEASLLVQCGTIHDTPRLSRAGWCEPQEESLQLQHVRTAM